jgi:hypothetical protein
LAGLQLLDLRAMKSGEARELLLRDAQAAPLQEQLAAELLREAHRTTSPLFF